MESGFWASSSGLPGPGSLLLLSAAIAGTIPATASAADPIPRNPRRVNVPRSYYSVPLLARLLQNLGIMENPNQVSVTETDPTSVQRDKCTGAGFRGSGEAALRV